MQRVHHHDPEETSLRQPIERRGRVHHPHIDEQRVECTIHAEHLLDPHRPHERRQNHRRKHEDAEKLFPYEIITVRHQRQRKGDQQGQQRAHHPHHQRVPKPLAVDRIRKNRPDEIKRPQLFPVRTRRLERLPYHHPCRIHEKHCKQRHHRQADPPRQCPVHHGRAPFVSAMRRASL